MASSTIHHVGIKGVITGYLSFGGLLESAVGFVNLVVPRLLCFRQLESLEVIERGSRSSGDDAFVKGAFFPLFVDLGGSPGLAHGASASAVSNGDLVFHQTHVFKLHRLTGNAWSINEGDKSMLERADAHVGNATDLHEIVENADSHFYKFEYPSQIKATNADIC